MKKLLIPMVAFATFLFVACSKPSPVDEAISLIEEATEQVEKAKNITELESISQDFEAKFDALDKKYPDFKPTADEDKKLDEVQKKFEDAMQKKVEEFLDDIIGDGDNPGEPEE